VPVIILGCVVLGVVLARGRVVPRTVAALLGLCWVLVPVSFVVPAVRGLDVALPYVAFAAVGGALLVRTRAARTAPAAEPRTGGRAARCRLRSRRVGCGHPPVRCRVHRSPPASADRPRPADQRSDDRPSVGRRSMAPAWVWAVALWAGPVLVTVAQPYVRARLAGRPVHLVSALRAGARLLGVLDPRHAGDRLARAAGAAGPGAVGAGAPPAPRRRRGGLGGRAALLRCAAAARRHADPPEYATLGASIRSILLDRWLGIGMLLYAVVAGAVVAVDMTRRYHERDRRAAERETQLEGQLARAQLDALRAQLNPHFLFNALNSVAMLVRAGARAEAVRALAELAELLRRALYGPSTAEVPLRDELGFVERYLAWSGCASRPARSGRRGRRRRARRGRAQPAAAAARGERAQARHRPARGRWAGDRARPRRRRRAAARGGRRRRPGSATAPRTRRPASVSPTRARGSTACTARRRGCRYAPARAGGAVVAVELPRRAGRRAGVSAAPRERVSRT
jgi:hypothetical protein